MIDGATGEVRGITRNGQYIPHRRVALFFDGSKEPSQTRQEFTDECDINALMARYQKTGVISHVNQREPVYLDVTGVLPLQEALRVVDEANTAFALLPARVRAEFGNDAERFVEFASDPAHLDQMREWGLAPPAAPAADLDAPAVEPAPPPPERPKAAPRASKAAQAASPSEES